MFENNSNILCLNYFGYSELLLDSLVRNAMDNAKEWYEASCWRAYDSSSLFIMPGVERAVQIIGVNLCLLVLSPGESKVLQGSHLMNAPGIL